MNNIHDPLQEIVDTQESILRLLVKLSHKFKRVSDAVSSWGLEQEEQFWVRFVSTVQSPPPSLTNSQNYLRIHSRLFDDISASLSKFSSDMGPVRFHVEFLRSLEVSIRDLKRRKTLLSSQVGETPDQLKREVKEVDMKIRAEEDRMPDMKRAMITQWMKTQYTAIHEFAKDVTVVGDCGVTIVDTFAHELPDTAPIPPYKISPVVAQRTERRLSEYGFSPSQSPSRSNSIRRPYQRDPMQGLPSAFASTASLVSRTESENPGVQHPYPEGSDFPLPITFEFQSVPSSPPHTDKRLTSIASGKTVAPWKRPWKILSRRSRRSSVSSEHQTNTRPLDRNILSSRPQPAPITQPSSPTDPDSRVHHELLTSLRQLVPDSPATLLSSPTHTSSSQNPTKFNDVIGWSEQLEFDIPFSITQGQQIPWYPSFPAIRTAVFSKSERIVTCDICYVWQTYELIFSVVRNGGDCPDP
ncbi:hypothetical protein JAAARDRAFT_492249 [Jaapia argillacea MUCL 33604]|uniref:Uncharacterized protein n=1 Tax=Jaapia argillacea MUCL 33604 TaxID=933084 RepID=A0A067PLT6_9AGAM|nr:hypothetical protein JAAARDRAFT_492249 [Jaapia argillacea MUCL 33604]